MKTTALLLIILCSLTTLAQFSNQQLISNSAARGAECVQASDIDGDGDMDVLSASYLDNKIAWYENDGYGHFGLQKIVVSGQVQGAKCVWSSDLDDDGDMDVLSASYTNDRIAWYPNDGNQNFGSQIILEAGADGAHSVTAADLDEDGDMDVISGHYLEDQVMVFLNQGAGVFSPGVAITVLADGVQMVTTGDIDGNGSTDIIAVSYTGNSLKWWPNDGSGNFPTENTVYDEAGFGKLYVHVADLDADGDLDILDANEGSNGNDSYFENDGSGNFSSTSGLNAHARLSTDINNDGNLDLLAGGLYALGVMPGNGDGTFDSMVSIQQHLNLLHWIDVADLNGDGLTDILTASYDDDRIAWFKNVGSFNFGSMREITRGTAGSTHVDVADINGDNVPDILCASLSDDKFSYYLSNGSGGFSVQQVFNAESNDAAQINAVDLDSDNDNDVMVAYQGYLINDEDAFVAWYENYGQGVFGPAQIITPALSFVVSFALEDLDLDGDIDLCLASNPMSLQWYENTGNGIFNSPVQLIAPGNWSNAPSCIEIYDLNNDGYPDIVTEVDNDILWFENQSNGNFAASVTISEFAGDISDMEAADYNGDTWIDLAIANTTTDEVYWLENSGAEEFYPPQIISSVDLVPSDLEVCDLNGDEINDLLIASKFEGWINYYRGTGVGTFEAPEVVSLYTDDVNSIVARDLNGDGVPEVISASEADGKLAWYAFDYINGCTDPLACNYDEIAEVNDGSCLYGSVGCPDPDACNYDPDAVCLLCLIPGCTDPTMCNFNPAAECDDGTCANIEGCLDPEACNYDPIATCPLTCNYPGCTDPNACNYNPAATCTNNACEYIFNGQVYFDGNGDGFFTPFTFNDVPMSNIKITLLPIGLIVYTNQTGEYLFENIAPGTYSLVVDYDDTSFSPASSAEITINSPGCNTSNIGFTLLNPVPISLQGPCCIFSMNIHCTNGFNPGLWLSNIGPVPLNGEVTVSYSDILVSEALVAAETPTSIETGITTWDIINLPPGQENLYQCHIVGPGAEYIGQVFPITIHIVLWNNLEEIYYDFSWVLNPEVVCAYDPNDKYAEPMGYTTENHFIAPEQVIEYRIRFQNTGNFPAEDIVITDSLDVSVLDLETFQPVFGSHSFMTCLQPSGYLEFVFEDIMLPDSTSDEPNSQGYVVFRISPHEGLDAGTVINNTAGIIFDGNEPVITNTMYHTIYECTNALANIDASGNTLIAGDIQTFSSTEMYIEEYAWTIENEDAGNSDNSDWIFEHCGTFTVGLTASNPLCEASNSIEVEIDPTVPVFSASGNELAISEGISWQWYFEGEPIDGATESSYEITEDGNYAVEITDAWGCTSISDEVFVLYIGIAGLDISSTSLFPNPMNDVTYLMLNSTGNDVVVSLLNAGGELIREWKNPATRVLEIRRENLARGIYTILITNNHGSFSRSLVVE